MFAGYPLLQTNYGAAAPTKVTWHSGRGQALLRLKVARWEEGAVIEVGFPGCNIEYADERLDPLALDLPYVTLGRPIGHKKLQATLGSAPASPADACSANHPCLALVDVTLTCTPVYSHTDAVPSTPLSATDPPVPVTHCPAFGNPPSPPLPLQPSPEPPPPRNPPPSAPPPPPPPWAPPSPAPPAPPAPPSWPPPPLQACHTLGASYSVASRAMGLHPHTHFQARVQVQKWVGLTPAPARDSQPCMHRTRPFDAACACLSAVC